MKQVKIIFAKKLAGYADTSSTADIVKGLKDEILEATQMWMARNAPSCDVNDRSFAEPTELGIKER